MKNKQKNSLFLLITRSYFLFMLALLLMFLGVYKLWEWRTSTLLSDPKVEDLLALPALNKGEYSKLPVKRLLGNGAAIAVLDSSGNLIFSSARDFSPSFTSGELDCIGEYNSGRYISSMDYTTNDGSIYHIVTEETYSNEGTLIESRSMELDSDFNIIEGGWQPERTGYTKTEYALLTGSYSSGSTLYRLRLINSDGEITLLLRLENWNAANYESALASGNRTWFLLIPLFGITAVLFVLWLSRKIKLPLSKLNLAITDLSEGREANASACGGPHEIRRIGENFDNLALRLAKSEQERTALDQQRQTLIADISHDLKTPITVISGYARAITDGKIPAESVPDYLKVIDKKASSLSELIDSFHEYSKADHPEFSLSCQKTELCEFMREYLASKYEEIELAGFSLEVNIPEQKLFCSLDVFQFRRALDNLLSNTLRHNTLGTMVFVSLLTQRQEILLRIGDNGRGIPASLKGKIFEPFMVGDDSRSGGGSGLGLAITKRIVEAHGGKIRLLPSGAPGRATEFEISLPLR